MPFVDDHAAAGAEQRCGATERGNRIGLVHQEEAPDDGVERLAWFERRERAPTELDVFGILLVCARPRAREGLVSQDEGAQRVRKPTNKLTFPAAAGGAP
jgi:hypothetical protein